METNNLSMGNSSCCCGDDSNENYMTSSYSSPRCCTGSSYCLVDGHCLGYGESEDYSGNGRDICCDPIEGYDYTLGSVACTTCASGYQMGGGYCYTGITCEPPDGWQYGSRSTCTAGQSGNTCYINPSCGSSGCSRTGDTDIQYDVGAIYTVECTTCSSGYQYDDPNNNCLKVVNCDGSGWTADGEEVEYCRDNGYYNNRCYYGEGCNAGGCTTNSVNCPSTSISGGTPELCNYGRYCSTANPYCRYSSSDATVGSATCLGTCSSGYENYNQYCYAGVTCGTSGWNYLVADTTFDGEEGSVTCSSDCSSGFYWDIVGEIEGYCYSNVECASNGWRDNSGAFPCYNNGVSGRYLYYNAGCDSGGCTTQTDVCSTSRVCGTRSTGGTTYRCYCVDSSDSNCYWSTTAPSENSDARCGDTVDNDCDGSTDCSDSQCYDNSPCCVGYEGDCSTYCCSGSYECTNDGCCNSDEWFNGITCRDTANCGTPCTPWNGGCSMQASSNIACCDLTRPGGVYDEMWVTIYPD